MNGRIDSAGGDQTAPVPPPAAPSEPDPTTPPIDRAAALAAGAPGIPAKFLYWVLGAALVLSFGGFLGERLFSAAGLNPAPTAVPRPVTTLPTATPDAPGTNRSVRVTLGGFMGMSEPAPRPAPPFTLTDQAGGPVSVPAQPPTVVVLTFFNAACNDICPVVAAEIGQADEDLGANAARVEFLTVNTDPSALSQSADEPVLSETHLGALANWRMATGTLTSLNSVWNAYGVSITLDEKTGLEAHNDVMDFVDAHGVLRYRAMPFANESTIGTYSLSSADIDRWGEGIASYAERLIQP